MKGYRLFLKLFFALTAFAVKGSAQDLESMQFELLDEQDGLSNHAITKMVSDGSGYLWIATVDGLNRYDGYSFKTFKHAEGDSTSIQKNMISGLTIDRKGNLWLGFTEGGMSRYDATRQCFFNYYPDPKKGLVGSEYGNLYFDKNNTLWFSGRAMGLNKFDTETGKVTNYHLPNILQGYPERDRNNYNSVGKIYEASDGLFWLGTANGLYTFDRKTESFTYLQDGEIDLSKSRNDYFIGLVPEKDKGFWLGAWGGGISYFDRTSKKFTLYKYFHEDMLVAVGNIVQSITEKNENELWVATSGEGLGVFNKQTGKFAFNQSTSVSASQFPLRLTTCMITMPDGTMFVNSEAGLMKYSPYSKLFNFKTLSIATSQNKDQFEISAMYDDTLNHKMYFGTTLGNGLNVLDKATGKLTAYAVETAPGSKAKYTYVRNLYEDRHGRFWVITRDVLYEFDKKKNKLERIHDPLEAKDEHVASYAEIVEDADGDIWIATYKKGLMKYSYRDNKFTVFPKPLQDLKDVASSGISYLTLDKFNRLWCITDDDQVLMYDKTKNTFSLPLEKEAASLKHIGIYGMTSDASGNLWLPFRDKGLMRVTLYSKDSLSTKFITVKDGLPLDNITGIQTDPNNNIWLAAISGVVMFNAVDNKYRVFNQAEGMDRNFSSIKFMTVSGKDFYLAVWGLYCKVNFDALDKKFPAPRVYIDKFKIYDKEIPTDFSGNKTLKIKPAQNFFSFDFGCIDFINQSQNKFAYMLEGWDKDWVNSQNRRYASYTNLDGGNYVFKVKAQNNSGEWSEAVSVPILIMTPLYKKGWFIVSVALLLSAMIFGLYHYRIREIERTERLKTKFNQELSETRMQALRAQMNPHFIFNCLNSINRYIIKSDTKTASLYLTKFAKLIRLILDNSENRKVVLSNELDALKLYIEMEALRFDNKFSYNLKVADNVGADSIEVPPLIIQPYVENAIWHGLLHKEENGELKINVSRLNGTLICEIEDNGIGREKAKEFKSKLSMTRKSVGMKLTEERLKIMNENTESFGSVEIVDLKNASGEANGTKVILQIPV